MNLIYILTIILMFFLHMLIYKKEEKQNLLKWIAISIMIFLCYNIFICVIMSILGIKSTIISLVTINIILDILLGIKIVRDKKTQKYDIQKMDILSIILILSVTAIVVVNQYGIPFNIKNATTDATVHYFVADEFYHNSMLLYKGNSDIFNLWKVDFFMPGAYINTGILFKIFSNIISETYFCQLFILFDICIWCLSGILMYVLLSKKQKIIPLIFSIIYMLGYPLNSLLSGFSYLSLALNLIITLVIIMQEDINRNYKNILMLLLNLGIFFSYYFFVPVVYLAVFLQIILENKRKIFTKQNILNIIYTLIIPSLFGITYFLVFQFIKFGTNPVSNSIDIIGIAGYIYNNFITNIVVFILLSVYYILNCIKNKKSEIQNKMLILTIAFMIVLFMGKQFKIVSEYYYYKSYYLVWIFLISVGYKGIEILLSKKRIMTYILIGIYSIGVVTSILLEQKLLIFDIYRKNSELINIDYNVIDYSELEVLDYYNKNINTSSDKLDKNTYMCIPKIEKGRNIWVYVITRNLYNYIDLSFGELTEDINQFIESDKKYCILLKQDYCGEYDKIDFSQLKILFRNESGIIVEKN